MNFGQQFTYYNSLQNTGELTKTLYLYVPYTRSVLSLQLSFRMLYAKANFFARREYKTPLTRLVKEKKWTLRRVDQIV